MGIAIRLSEINLANLCTGLFGRYLKNNILI